MPSIALSCLSLPVSRPTRPYRGTCPATEPRSCRATRRVTARCPATAWCVLTASAAWQAPCMTGPSAPPPPQPSPQRRKGGRWGMTPCGSCMSGSRGRPSPGKVWHSQQVLISLELWRINLVYCYLPILSGNKARYLNWVNFFVIYPVLAIKINYIVLVFCMRQNP